MKQTKAWAMKTTHGWNMCHSFHFVSFAGCNDVLKLTQQLIQNKKYTFCQSDSKKHNKNEKSQHCQHNGLKDNKSAKQTAEERKGKRKKLALGLDRSSVMIESES